MRLRKIIFSPKASGHFYEDADALAETPMPLAQRYRAKAKTPGFNFVREPGEAVSIGAVLDDGSVHWGDALSVSYGGKSGRDPVFRSRAGMAWLQAHEAWFKDRDFDSWRGVMTQLEQEFPSCSRALLFGLSQALLSATAAAQRCSAAAVVCKEWSLPQPTALPPLHGQSGPDFYDGVDRLIIHGIPFLPHGQVDDLPTQFGAKGEHFLTYVAWVKQRIKAIGAPDFQPVLDFDVHGAMGTVFQNNPKNIVDFLLEVERACQPFKVRIECPVLCKDFKTQQDLMVALTSLLSKNSSDLMLIVDEWANTHEDIVTMLSAGAGHGYHIKAPDLGSMHHCVEAVLAIKAANKISLLGGSCNETDVSARVTAQIALSTQPTSVLCKPGLGIDEGIAIMLGEMQRAMLAEFWFSSTSTLMRK